MARLLLGVSGGIAAYKALELARLAVKAGHGVRVIQTTASRRFVGAASFEAITGAPVLSSEFESDSARGAYPGEPFPHRAPISHLALVDRAELYLIAPASANTIAKLAHGHADNLLSTAALAARCPVAVAPAMNNHMYLHPATQANLELLSARGVSVIGPEEGALASHSEHGIGRLAEPAALLEVCERLLAPPTLAGVRVLISAGGTREPIDSVRFIGNRSSGRMGFALAGEAARRGAEVTVIAANVNLEAPPGVRVHAVATAAELAHGCRREFERCDVLLMAAAVADFRPRRPAAGKLKKDAGTPVIELAPTSDVLSDLVARRRRRQVIVGFAAEHGEDALVYGRQKLAGKGLDAIVVNDISRPEIGFDAAENEVTILTRDGDGGGDDGGGGHNGGGGHDHDGEHRHDEHLVTQTSKDHVARAILDVVQRLRERNAAAGREPTGGLRADTGSAAGI
ncbi:MAG: bifunctional phosphopantothenoylcysteine decarboxylase/phosphopantothenate--cysteine ligase CoaBC [Actinomycetota bacterium]|nr:bifunctional phosphopantothenoylcysteine decarboxylase/phosphopantothenate--cysteine ligase CoaBC [Actinomycetota bacterium]